VTIRRGEAWGIVGPLPAGAVRVESDAGAAQLVERARHTNEPPPTVHLVGGDLWRTCGGPSRPAESNSVAILPVDVGVVRVDGEERVFVAHLVARGRTWWFGPVLVVGNAQYVSGWDMVPRSHPADGHVDVLEIGAMPLSARWQLRRRLPTGTHVPHPAIAQRRVREATFVFDRPRRVWLDGVRISQVAELSMRVEPAALTVCV
jgi:YegS C-terminal NAD kinase beta sandwich-like domain